MGNLLRISKVNKTPGFPLRASTLYKWLHCRPHPELFVRLGGAVFVNLDKLNQMIEAGGTQKTGSGKRQQVDDQRNRNAGRKRNPAEGAPCSD